MLFGIIIKHHAAWQNNKKWLDITRNGKDLEKKDSFHSVGRMQINIVIWKSAWRFLRNDKQFSIPFSFPWITTSMKKIKGMCESGHCHLSTCRTIQKAKYFKDSKYPFHNNFQKADSQRLQVIIQQEKTNEIHPCEKVD